MKAYLLIAGLLLGVIANPAAEPKSDAAAAFARLKSLVGEWEGGTDMGKAHLTYELIADGSALVERETMENMPSMLTVYYLDGDRLLLTHYCMKGNQPRMQVHGYDPATGELAFQFLDATNLAAGGGHMHNATIRLVDDRHFTAQWQFYENGRQKFAETAQYTRVR